jgi:integrase
VGTAGSSRPTGNIRKLPSGRYQARYGHLEESAERPIPGWGDIQRIAATIHPRVRALVRVRATSGLRFGELTGLTRRLVHLEDRAFRVEQALTFARSQDPTLGPLQVDNYSTQPVD